MTIGDHPDLADDPNTDIDGDGDMDSADATKDNREAQRDLDYTATLASLTILRNAVSGTATITITPQNQLPGTIRVASPDFDADAPGIQIADDGLTINPVDIKNKEGGRCHGRCHYTQSREHSRGRWCDDNRGESYLDGCLGRGRDDESGGFAGGCGFAVW